MLFLFANSPAVFPVGLTFATLFSPLLYFWLFLHGHRKVLLKFFIATSPFILANALIGVEWSSYLKSFAMAIAIYVTVYSFVVAVRDLRKPDKVLETLIWVNFVLTCVGLLLWLTPWFTLMWTSPESVTYGADPISRFKMLTYEPSHYSTIIAPITLYAYWLAFRSPSLRSLTLLIATAIPLAISLSFGVLSALVLAIAFTHLRFWRELLKHRWLLFGLAIAAVAVLLLPSDNLMVKRVVNLLNGQDSSGNARTVLSYAYAYEIAAQKSLLFGVGFGQIKLVGTQIINWGDGRLPCAAAETFAQFGFLGLALRLVMQFVLFFRTRTFDNSFRLSCFAFMFIYQFTGSFLTNISEYLLWVLAFSPVLPQFGMAIQKRKTRQSKPLPGATSLPVQS